MTLQTMVGVDTNSDADTDLLAVFLELNRSEDGPVVVFNERLLACNSAARELLSASDLELLQRQQVGDGGQHGLDIPFDAVGILEAVPCTSGVVLKAAANGVITAPQHVHTASEVLPGTSGATERARAQFLRIVNTNASAMIVGELGSAKLRIARAIFQTSGAQFREFDVSRNPTHWLGSLRESIARGDDLLVHRADHAADEILDQLLVLVDQARAKGVQVLVTCRSSEGVAHSALTSRIGLQLIVVPLRERLEDIPALVEAVIAVSGRGVDEERRLTTAALRMLWSYSWPGNAMELERVVRDAVARTIGPFVDQREIRLPSLAKRTDPQLRLTALQAAERNVIIDALRRCGGNKNQTAAMLGVARSTLYYKLHGLGLQDATLHGARAS